jgi:hypothetical protein
MLKATDFRRQRRAVALALMAALGGGLLAGCQQPAINWLSWLIGYLFANLSISPHHLHSLVTRLQQLD